MKSISSKESELVGIIQALSLTRSLTEITEVVRTAARRLTGADGATFVLRDDDRCFYVDEDAIRPLWKGQKFHLDHCVSGWVMRNGRALSIEDIFKDARVPIEAYRDTFVKSLVMVPIRTANPIGAIGTYWASAHVADQEEIALLQALADSASVAMENVQLYSTLEGKVLELERALLAKEQFLMTLSHELRTPLTSIIGWSEELLTPTSAPELLAKGLSSISRNARHQAKIVDDLLDTTRILSGKLLMEPAPLDLLATLNSVIANMRPMIDVKGISIVIERDSTVPVTIVGDSTRIQQIMGNILSNGIKFSPRGGKVTVSFSMESNWILMRFRDEGQGISESFLPRIFERFLQADGTTTRAHGGLGLGLSIARSLIEGHGGTIRVESPGLGKGATFTLIFPIIDANNKKYLSASEKKETATELLSGIRFLTIDDDADCRELIAHFLTKQGGEVATAEGASEGFRKIEEFEPDFIICDLSMPGEDGYSFIQKLRATASDDLRNLPAIAFSAFTDLSHEHRAIAAGFDSFIPKPLDGKQFLNRVLEIWRNSKQSAALSREFRLLS